VQPVEVGCENAQLVPTPWHVVQADALCPEGLLWQLVHVAEEPGCENAHVSPTP